MKKFYILWAGELISTIGSGMTAFGLGVYVYQQTQLASATALVSLLALLPTVLLVPEESYSRASGLIQIASSARYLISPFLAGFLMKFAGIVLILWMDVCTFFVTVTATLFVANSMGRKQAESRKSFFEEFREGVGAITGKTGVLLLVVLSMAVCFFLTFIQTLCTPMILAFSDEATLGVCETICAAGMLVSSLIIGMVTIKKDYVKILAVSFFSIGIFMMLFGLRENIILVTIAGFLFFMGLPFANTCLDILVRRNIPNELQGRAWGMISLISQMGYVLANAVIGPLADYVCEPSFREGGIFYQNIGKLIGAGTGRGSALLIMAGGLCLCILAPCVYHSKSIRVLEETL